MNDLETQLANNFLQQFINGELDLADEEVCIDNQALYSAAEQELSDLLNIHGDDAFEELTCAYPEWPLDRRVQLAKGKVKPNIAEITEHMTTVLENDDDGVYVIMVGKFALRHLEETIGWVVIREAGIALEREHEIVGICKTDIAAALLIKGKFEMSAIIK
jgi:hypothetical protein